MNIKTRKELKKFKEFKKNYEFKQKELEIKDDLIYCDGQLVKQDGFPGIGESEVWIDVGYNNKSSFSKMLSNLYPYEFKFRGKKLNSLECFFQGIKFKDKKIQNLVFKYSGKEALYTKAATNYDWKKNKIVYWQGKGINRLSKDYGKMIDELYICAIQNPLYRGALLNCTKDIIHVIGDLEKENTTFTRYEFEYQLNCLKDFVKYIDNK